MSREGGRPVGLPTLTLIIALVAANLALVALNLRKYNLPPFASIDDDAGEPVAAGPGADSSNGPEGFEGSDAGVTSGGDGEDGTAEDGVGESVADGGSGRVSSAVAARVEAVLFHDAGQVGLPGDRPAELDEIAAAAAGDARLWVSVVAHIDDFGGGDANVAVAFARASAVVDYLELAGVDRSRVVVAIPPADPEAQANESEDQRRFNRRVEVTLLGRLPGGTAAPGGSGSGADGGSEGGSSSGSGSGSDGGAADGSSGGTSEAGEERWSVDGALVAGFDCGQPVVGEPLRVGYAVDRSGPGWVADGPGSEAAGHLARMINCSGGVEGRPVEVLVVDVSGTVLGSRPAMMELLAWQPDAIIGPSTVAVGLRLREMVAGRVPVVFPVSTEPALADPALALFTVVPVGPPAGEALARFAVDRGWTEAVIVHGSDGAYQTDGAWFSDAFVAAGGVVQAVVEDSAGLAAALVGGNAPDVVFTSLGPEPFNELQEQVAGLGLDVAVLNADPSAAHHVDARFGDRSFGLTPVLPEADGRMARLDQSFAAATGSSSTNPAAAALVGDALALIINAQLGGWQDDVESGSALIESPSIQGVSGVLSYPDGAGAPTRPTFVIQQLDDEIVPVATIEPQPR